MPRSEEANQRIREERKEHIFQAAAHVFARKGLAATRIADIASAGKMSQGLIFRYFTSKEEIFSALVERALLATMMLVEAAQDHPGSTLDKLRWLLAQYLPGMWQNPDYALVIQHALYSEATPPEVRTLVLEQSARFLQFLQGLIVQGQATGEMVQGDPMMLALTLGACISGLSADVQYAPDLLGVQGPPDPDMLLRIIKA